MIIYSNLIKLFKHCGNYILFKLIMNIHEYSEYLDYFFDTLITQTSTPSFIVGGTPGADILDRGLPIAFELA
jgi:hypothetical protein